MTPGLTEKQRRFVEAYMGQAKGNATEAARLAGYSGTPHALEVTASRLLRNAEVRAVLAHLAEQTTQDAIATAEECHSALTSILRKSDNEFARIKAIERLSKMRGYEAVEKQEIKHEGAMVRIVLPDNGRDGATA
jgi:phage terminase small subunit